MQRWKASSIVILIDLVDRAFLLFYPKFHSKNFELIVKILLDNGYPLALIFNTIHSRLKKLINVKRQNPPKCLNNKDDKKYFNFPYISGLSERFSHVIRNKEIILSYTEMNKLRKYIKVHKDRLPNASRKNVVYKISCNNYDASCVGQTGRLLSTRVKEHRNHINRKTGQSSVVTDHRLLNHEFDWEGVEILDEKLNLNKRLMFEMLYIKHQKMD